MEQNPPAYNPDTEKRVRCCFAVVLLGNDKYWHLKRSVFKFRRTLFLCHPNFWKTKCSVQKCLYFGGFLWRTHNPDVEHVRHIYIRNVWKNSKEQYGNRATQPFWKTSNAGLFQKSAWKTESSIRFFICWRRGRKIHFGGCDATMVGPTDLNSAQYKRWGPLANNQWKLTIYKWAAVNGTKNGHNPRVTIVTEKMSFESSLSLWKFNTGPR